MKTIIGTVFAHGVVTPTTATSAVLTSPLLSTVGIVLYERWQGSAANLNLWKCSFVSILFAGVVASTTHTVALDLVCTRMLVLSSFLGIVIGDLLWLQALKLLGARMTILQSTLQPLLAALAGALFLHQPLALSNGLAIGAVCGGLALAQTAKKPSDSDESAEDAEASSTLVHGTSSTDKTDQRPPRQLLLGSTLNLLNIGLDTMGSVLTRRYGQGLTTWQINTVRFGSAAVMTLIGLCAVNLWSMLSRPHEPCPEWAALVPQQPAAVWVACGVGALLVTFLATALSNYALFGLPLGIWSALSSMGPVWSIPVLYAVRKERTSARGVLGAALAVSGAAVCSMAARHHP